MQIYHFFELDRFLGRIWAHENGCENGMWLMRIQECCACALNVS
jgi:hypothetical protein